MAIPASTISTIADAPSCTRHTVAKAARLSRFPSEASTPFALGDGRFSLRIGHPRT